MPQLSDALIADALTLLSGRVAPKMMGLAESVAQDPDAWGLGELNTTDAKELARGIHACMTTYIYDAGDENKQHLPEDRETVRKFFYALADSFLNEFDD